jgi:hypothetical protein
MGEPQQRELARSKRGEITPHARKVTREADPPPKETGRRGRAPEESRPGHRPEKDQDKPEGAR